MNEEEKLEFEDQEEEQPIEILPKERRVYSDKPDRSIFELYRQYQKGNLELRPAFQRLHVWDNSKSSRLIESVLLEVPIPVIYLSEEPDSKYSVIDGQQRLNAFIEFLEKKLKLSGLTILTELNGKIFQDIPKNLQDKFENSTIRIIEIRKESHPDVKFEIFERLNTGAVQLNAQELRNCIYRGRYNDLLEELSQDKDFQSLLGIKGPHYRMYDRELILRFFAFYRNTHLNYNPPMKRFLNNEMKKYQNIDEEEAKKLRKNFRKSVRLSKTVFGDKSFRRFIQGTIRDPNGKWESNKINKALFDIVMYGFTRYEENQAVPNSDAIREELINLMTHDSNFLDTISTYTDNKDKIQLRFDKWLSAVTEIVGIPIKEPRTFSLEFKKQLWESNPTCAICRQKIHIIDDAEVDHIEQYWRGGKTIPANAQLTHRFCNRSRPLNGTSDVIDKKYPEPPKKSPKASGLKRPLGKKGYEQLTDYLIPVIRLIKSGVKHPDAFRRIADKLGVSKQTAQAECTVQLSHISTEQFVELIKNNEIKSFLKERFPDKANLIDRDLTFE